MSLLEWSPSTHSIQTVSIHYYERDEFKRETSTPVWYSPFVRLDPNSRCVLLSFYHDKIAVLPFKTELGLAGSTGLTSPGMNSPVTRKKPKNSLLPELQVPDENNGETLEQVESGKLVNFGFYHTFSFYFNFS